MTELPPLRREIVVDADAETAFRVFTERIGSWWPVARHSVYGAESSVAFVDGSIVESCAGEPDTVWGTVTAWRAPDELAFTWHPGQDPARASRVHVTFTEGDDGTLVRLVHSGWEVFAEPAAARAEYESSWPGVLDLLRDATGSTWAALLHRPRNGADPMDDPRFAEHVAFLARMAAGGYLVAAGPLDDEPGAGMTVLRLPGRDRLGDIRDLAHGGDRSVADGLLTVEVRPWSVRTIRG